MEGFRHSSSAEGITLTRIITHPGHPTGPGSIDGELTDSEDITITVSDQAGDWDVNQDGEVNEAIKGSVLNPFSTPSN